MIPLNVSGGSIAAYVKYVYREISEDVFLTAVDAYSSADNDAKLPVVRSAYYVHIAGQGETCVVAENIADAMDKIEKLTEANYTFIFNRSLPCII